MLKLFILLSHGRVADVSARQYGGFASGEKAVRRNGGLILNGIRGFARQGARHSGESAELAEAPAVIAGESHPSSILFYALCVFIKTKR
jgi:hypothetical protein